MKNLIISLVSALLLFFCACEKQDMETFSPPTPDGTDALKSGASTIETPLELSGVMHFYVYAVKEDHLVVDSKLPMTATLTHEGGQNYLLVTTETTPGPPHITYREMEIDVKITPGGQVKFSWPDEWMEIDIISKPPVLTPFLHTDMAEQVKEHTGYDLHGPGINKGTLDYKGFFDGEEFFAKWHWAGKQLVPGTFGSYIAMVDGLIKLEFSFELTVD